MRYGRETTRAKTDVRTWRARKLPGRFQLTLSLVDKVLESCFQLISLFFMTIGRTSEAPAAYSLTSTIKRLLDHLTEAGLFCAKDLESMSQTIGKLTSVMKNAEF